ncbi:MAG: PAS domain S-box protein [Deltaproteobacteria bacterium]|nr:PAS domain S-box protein [Deltaproteobacteria bacterium]
MIIRKKNLLLSVAIQVIVILSGLVMTALLVDYGRHEFRLDLLHHARIAASSFPPQQVQNLVNSPKQNRQNVCESVWARLQKIQQAIPQLRYIYLMQLVDGQVRFVADSDDPPCRDYSADDGIYAESSVELKNIFATGQPFVEGPLVDRWGNWVSGLAPIIDPDNGDVIAVLGVDIDADDYEQKIAIYRVFGLSITLLTWLLVLKFHFIYRRVRISRDHQAALNRSLTMEIDKRQEVEKALKESENLFRSIFANTAAGVVTISFKGQFLKGNPAFCQMLGYSATELEQMSQRDITHPDDLESSEKIYCDVVRHKPERFEIVKRYLCKDGTIVWVQITGSWVYEGENPIYAVLLVLDITERKQAGETLKKSELDYRQLYRQFQGLLNAIPDTIMLISPDMTIVWANRGAMDQFVDCQNLKTRHCFNLWQGLSQPCPDCPVQRCFASGEHEEQLIYAADGSAWAVRAYPLKDEHGKVVNVIDVCSDISEKIRLRAEADRNSRLASLGELAAGVAHEINNPNGLILLNTPMLRDVLIDALSLFADHYQQHGQLELGGLDYQELRDELPLMLQRIEGAAERIKRIVEDLKNFVRQGEVDLSDQLDLNEVVKAAIRMVDNSIKQATDHFEAVFGTLPRGQGDFQRIEQVVINLVQNACHALADRSAKIRLVTYFDAENKCNILQVNDEGSGIAPAALSHVTDPFYTTRRQSGGTGLGLSVSARIIREHGGQLEFRSTIGVGTVVTMKLPISEEGECA